MYPELSYLTSVESLWTETGKATYSAPFAGGTDHRGAIKWSSTRL